MLLVITFLSLFHHWTNLTVVLVHLLLLKISGLLLLLNNLVHEDGFVHTLGTLKTCGTSSIPLDFMLVTHWDRPVKESLEIRDSK